MAQRNVEWYSVQTKTAALCEMVQRNVEWYSIHTNGVALRRIALQKIRRSSWTLNCLTLYKIFRCCSESSSLLVRDVKAMSPKPPKLQTEQRSAGGMTSSNVKLARNYHMVYSLCWKVFTSPCRKAEPIRSFSVSLSSFFPADIAFIRCRSWKY